MTTLKSCNDRETWDDYCLENGVHPLQLWGWGEVKAAHGWRCERLFLVDGADETIGAAQLLIRHLPWPLRAMVYVPRGPVAAPENRAELLKHLAEHAKRKYRAAVLTVEPDEIKYDLPAGWRRSDNRILPNETILLDLNQTDEGLMADMSKKTRKYIRKSSNDDVLIRQISGQEELDQCLELYHQTARRAGFDLLDDQYYRDVFDKLADHSPVFAAYSGQQLVAFLWLAISADTAYELYGGVNETGQQLRANYALKWYAIRRCKQWGLKRYDFGGLIEGGVTTFKLGWAVGPTEMAGTFDRPLSPWYGLWSRGLPTAKKVTRRLKALLAHR